MILKVTGTWVGKGGIFPSPGFTGDSCPFQLPLPIILMAPVPKCVIGEEPLQPSFPSLGVAMPANFIHFSKKVKIVDIPFVLFYYHY